MKKINYLVLAACFLAGCATKTPDIATYVDPRTHTRTDLMGENMLEAPEPIREVVWLNASRMFKNSRDYQYYLEVDYMARIESGYLEIPTGETLVVVADGQELKFSGAGSINARKQLKEEVTERAIYPATGQQLRAIASAEKVRVSILGRNGLVQRTFTPANSERFRQFVQHYVSTT